MRYLVLSDIHANLEALESAMAAASTEGYDRVLVLGDLVGYGADPNGVIELIQGLSPAAVIRGGLCFLLKFKVGAASSSTPNTPDNSDGRNRVQRSPVLGM